MSKLFYVIVFFLSFSGYSQELFEYNFDDNITLNVLEETEEGQMANGKFIRSTFENEVITLSNSNKAKDILPTMNETSLLKLFQGVKDGNLKSTKGTLLNEEIITFNNIKVSKFKISLLLEGQKKVFETYVFAYKNIIYTFQFMNNESEFENLKNLRKSILDSIKFH
ncbi:hypothetical protein [Flavobacterium capsici]|uniref:Uncharacterized protein n=1 Tax=Flavobacterium capsici TaxID=3075618 RepID=A0AA96F2K7_9FLAO|nr:MULTISPECIES: hypothetical protein [unclassified Flavobacterium]WNM18695.1 hypothetical protein RN608_11845 [Flavobacterium sp. PMR2A8]WNM22746.1 hypothetical protein RN605_05145 [Flavobacterium sp. PMTSA4]